MNTHTSTASEFETDTPATGEARGDDAWRVSDVWEQRRRKRLPGVVYPHVGKSGFVDHVSRAEIDTARMTATAVITTPAPDRSHDVVDPLGVELDNYRRNPVVYFDHGLSGLTLPIARCEDDRGELALSVTEDGILATSYFSQSLKEAEQIFALIAERIIRTASIHLIPHAATVRAAGLGDRPGLLISRWELLEWSWVGIPDNPEAVAKILRENRLAGSPLAPSLMKSLLPSCDAAPTMWFVDSDVPPKLPSPPSPPPPAAVTESAEDADERAISKRLDRLEQRFADTLDALLEALPVPHGD